jgi:hypothetical protein
MTHNLINPHICTQNLTHLSSPHIDQLYHSNQHQTPNIQHPFTFYTNPNTLHILITRLPLFVLIKEKTHNLTNPHTCTQNLTHLPSTHIDQLYHSNQHQIPNIQHPFTFYTNLNTLHILITRLPLIFTHKKMTYNLTNPHTCIQNLTHLSSTHIDQLYHSNQHPTLIYILYKP